MIGILGPLYHRLVVGTVLAAKQALYHNSKFSHLYASGAFQALPEHFGCVHILYPIRGGPILLGNISISYPLIPFHRGHVTSRDGVHQVDLLIRTKPPNLSSLTCDIYGDNLEVGHM